jgi:hypothetical protein
MAPLTTRCAYLPAMGRPVAVHYLHQLQMVIVGTLRWRELREPFFQVVIFRLAFSQAERPAVTMDDDADDDEADCGFPQWSRIRQAGCSRRPGSGSAPAHIFRASLLLG